MMFEAKNRFSQFKALGPIAWIIGHWQIAAAIAAVLVMSNTATYFIGRDHGRDSEIADQLEAERAANKLTDQSEAQAAAERETETNSISNDKGAADEAILETNSKNVKPSAASDALNCERVRRNEADLSQFPACK